MNKQNSNGKPTFAGKVNRTLFGAPRDLKDSGIFHKIALIPFFAWIGLGSDGLSSSSYGPEEAFRALGEHTYLALFLGLGTALTVFIISFTYSRIIEHFPHGGGGYIVATHTLGKRWGVISGCALIVDYMLTITVSIVSCVNSLFSYLPMNFHAYKVIIACVLIVFLVILNIRGVKESITVLAPIFIVFIITHLLLLGYGLFGHLHEFQPVVQDFHQNYSKDMSTIGGLAILLIFLRAYSLGGGTYTGIEAVSNGLQIMREPKVKTGKMTMTYMATSLAVTAGGLFVCYLLMGIHPTEGKTLNSVLAASVFGDWRIGHGLAFITILSEGALLLVAAQTGFIDGPRVMANMAVDSWFPHRFASFSEQLSMRNGVLMMGIAALGLVIYTQGNISALIVMYSINVFLTFSISEFGMSRYFFKNRDKEPKWITNLAIQLVGLGLCLIILIITTLEKFMQGGWLTLVITTFFIITCYIINSHYSRIQEGIKSLDKLLEKIPHTGTRNNNPAKKSDMTAIQLVSSYSGLGIKTFLAIHKSFPGLYKNFIFVSVGVVDQGLFKGKEGMAEMKKSVEQSLDKYVDLARRQGYAAECRMAVGTDVVETATTLCTEVAHEFKHSTVFMGQITFRIETFYHRLLHNETAYAIQRRLQMVNVNNVIMPINIDLEK